MLLAMVAAVAPALGASAEVGGAPSPGSPAYLARDAGNIDQAFGRQLGPGGQLRDPAYLRALAPDAVGTELAQLEAQAANPTRPALTGGNLVPGWNDGNPYRRGWAGHRGRELQVSFTDRYGALLQGDVFAPLDRARDPYTGARLRGPYPGVVIVTGSVQASAGVYAWLAEDLAERGYVVLTFDVAGQGRSETMPHQGPNPDLPGCSLSSPGGSGEVTPCPGVPSEQAQNFVDGAEDAITFFLSTPARAYPDRGAGSARVNRFNPLWALVDHRPDLHSATPGRTTKLALIGHSTGAVTVSYLQGVDRRVETVAALDKLTATASSINDVGAALGTLPGAVRPEVPALALQSEYGFEPQPYWLAGCSSFDPCPGSPEMAPPPAREEATGFDVWRSAGVDSMIIVPRASTHLEYADVPFVLPASAWGQAMASYYVQAWLDKYLKHDPGADRLLTATTLHYLQPGSGGLWRPVTISRDSHLSFYFCSGYAFRLADGRRISSPDLIADGCR